MTQVVELASSPELGVLPTNSDKLERTAAVADINHGPPSSNTVRRRRTNRAAPEPGPSTLSVTGPATTKRKRRTKYREKYGSASSIMELTDSEDEHDGKYVRGKSPPKRAKAGNSATGFGSGSSGVGAPPCGKGKKKKEQEQVRFGEDMGLEESPSEDKDLVHNTVFPLQSAEMQQGSSRVKGTARNNDVGSLSNIGHAVPNSTTHQGHDQQTEPPQHDGQPSPEPERDEDILSSLTARVLEVIPDVDPEYLFALTTQSYPKNKENTVNLVLQMLIEDSNYPRVQKKEKRGLDTKAAVALAEGEKWQAKKVRVNDWVDYSSKDRPLVPGPDYKELALEQLQQSFPYVPKTFLRKTLAMHNSLYAPTHIYLKDLYKKWRLEPTECPPMGGTETYPFFPRKTRFRPPKTPKTREDSEFEKERKWVVAYDEVGGDLKKLRDRGVDLGDGDAGGDDGTEAGEGKGKEKETAEGDETDDEGCAEGEGIECACCFTEYPFEKMIQCPEAHLFCKTCVSTYASNLLGSHDINLKCMHQSGCSVLFPDSELRRVLSVGLLELYDRLKQQREIAEADLEGLEECPFCDWKCVMEMDRTQEKLFRCGNSAGDCGAVSCRECKRLEHLPKSCKEMDEEKVLNGHHAVEEAMSAALMRNCPKCNKAFIKDFGCNKITCNGCGTLSCYVCRQIIRGYEHFDRTPGNVASTSKAGGLCPLYDSVEARHAEEVRDCIDRHSLST
ncbi:hypothetical protein AX17_006551 [Amanita inopinata Kibby_2008]|nr:hypothetical protein AX17_006551 [Amanita inopinata Kibby_2008]